MSVACDDSFRSFGIGFAGTSTASRPLAFFKASTASEWKSGFGLGLKWVDTGLNSSAMESASSEGDRSSMLCKVLVSVSDPKLPGIWSFSGFEALSIAPELVGGIVCRLKTGMRGPVALFALPETWRPCPK